jgi:glycosyltransferase involved in cell wall biosynthesis
MAYVQGVLGKMKICAVIPAHNEARTIGYVVESLAHKHIDAVVIDDGSTDRSGELARSKGAHVIRNKQKSGKGGSLKVGFHYAQEKKYDAVIALDGDGQHDVADLHLFLAQAQKDPISVITGNRMANAKGMPFVRFCTNHFMSWMISRACKQHIPDTQCGYRYIHCDVLKSFDLVSNDFEIETEILIQASKKGFPIHSVPVKTIYSDEESKIRPLKDTIRFFNYFFKEAKRKPS